MYSTLSNSSRATEKVNHQVLTSLFQCTLVLPGTFLFHPSTNVHGSPVPIFYFQQPREVGEIETFAGTEWGFEPSCCCSNATAISRWLFKPLTEIKDTVTLFCDDIQFLENKLTGMTKDNWNFEHWFLEEDELRMRRILTLSWKLAGWSLASHFLLH